MNTPEAPKVEKEKIEDGEKKRESRQELPRNVVVVETPEGRFRIVYGWHSSEQGTEDIGDKYNVLVLETSTDGEYDTSEKAALTMEKFRNHVQYRSIVRQAEKDRKPIFFVDFYDGELINILQMALEIAEASTAYLILESLARDILDNRGISRREFLKTAAKGIAGVYLSSSMLADLSKLAAGSVGAKELARFINDLNERYHPETQAYLLTFRNHIIAQKLHTILQKYNFGIKSGELALVIGSGHRGIETALKKDPQSRKSLVDLLADIRPGTKYQGSISKIARFDFSPDKNRWEVTDIFDDPVLTRFRVGLEKERNRGLRE